MKLVLNIGMHKTGTSAIQQSLGRFDRDGVRYLPLGHPNQSAIYATMFMAEPHTYGAHRKNSRSPADVAALRDKFSQGYEEAIAKARADGIEVLMSSAEDLVLMSEDTLARLRDWAEARFSDVVLVGYARPPVSFMTSALQQRVAGGVKWTFRNLYPGYRERFESFDRVFGRDRVILKKFHRDRLKNGDVVQDYAAHAGLEISPDEVISDNQSRSLQSTAALQAQRVLGRGWLRYPGAPADNHKLVDRLRGLGTDKIVLHPDVVTRIVGANQDDIDWITDRLGVDFVDAPAPGAENSPGVIAGQEDFLHIAGQQLPGVLDLIKAEVGTREVDPQIVAQAVDLLLDVIRDTPKGKPGAKPAPGKS
jgi:hypothetical protein